MDTDEQYNEARDERLVDPKDKLYKAKPIKVSDAVHFRLVMHKTSIRARSINDAILDLIKRYDER